MTHVRTLINSALRTSLAISICWAALPAVASNSNPKPIRVPQDFATIQLAVNAAPAGATIHVAQGNWCGATITSPVDLEGDGRATIIGCSTSPTEIFDSSLRIGFLLTSNASGTSTASGTTIRNFIFNGQGWSVTNRSPLAEGVRSRTVIVGTTPVVVNGVTVDHNQFLGGVAGVSDIGGSNWLIVHNVLSGFTIDHTTTFGGYGIDFQRATNPATTRGVDNEASYNSITTTVANGVVPAEFFILNPDVAFSGVIADSQDGLVLRNNKISIASNPSVLDGGDGAGMIIGDFSSPGFLTTTNSVIINNDGRGSVFAIIIPPDSGGGTGNTAGAYLRGNLGVNIINNTTTTVGNRSIQLALSCNSSGVCQ